MSPYGQQPAPPPLKKLRLPHKPKKQRLSQQQHSALAAELCHYAAALLRANFTADYRRQIGKWRLHAGLLATALDAAHSRYSRFIDPVPAENAVAMLALAAVAKHAFPWLSTAVEIAFPPKFARLFATPAPSPAALSATYDTLAAKTFGDTPAAAVKLGAERVFALPQPPLPGSQASLVIGIRGQIPGFQTALENAIGAELAARTQAIALLASQIEAEPAFGSDVLRRAYRLVPGAEYDSPVIQEVTAKSLIRSDIDSTRGKWAESWLYYGHDPAPESLDAVTATLETAIWAFWIRRCFAAGAGLADTIGPRLAELGIDVPSGNLLLWATQHTPQTLGAGQPFCKRTLIPIEKVHDAA
ncbi:MAG: hypothetical protein JNK48_01400 [Bryobacterales bacterium]|nr:hypothetical protein [Bryobacterales bacterium]